MPCHSNNSTSIHPSTPSCDPSNRTVVTSHAQQAHNNSAAQQRRKNHNAHSRSNTQTQTQTTKTRTYTQHVSPGRSSGKLQLTDCFCVRAWRERRRLARLRADYCSRRACCRLCCCCCRQRWLAQMWWYWLRCCCCCCCCCCPRCRTCEAVNDCENDVVASVTAIANETGHGPRWHGDGDLDTRFHQCHEAPILHPPCADTQPLRAFLRSDP